MVVTASLDLVQIGEHVKVFPLVVLGVLLALGGLIYVGMKFGDKADPLPAPRPDLPVSKQLPAVNPVTPKVDAPPPPNQDPGAKILEGADRAFQQQFYETALKFYLDFDLRYAGSDVHERNVARVWEQIRASAAGMPKKDETIPAQLEARRKLHAEWTQLRSTVAQNPAEAPKARIQAFLDALPPKDGRRPKVEAWLAAPKDGPK